MTNKAPTIRQISVTACVLLVALRVAIGWQFLYEGLWKYNTQSTASPWSADGYLANSQGPFRNVFRSLVDDPDGLKKLNYDTVAGRWDLWRDQFVAHYSKVKEEPLTEAQVSRINELLEGPERFGQSIKQLPKGVELDDKGVLKKFQWQRPTAGKEAKVWYDAERKELITNTHLLDRELDQLLKGVPEDDPQYAAYKAACEKFIQRSQQLSLKERLRSLLIENHDRTGLIQEQYAGSADHKRAGDVDVYKHQLERYNRDLAAARMHYQHDHLNRVWTDIVERRGKLVGPVDALTSELYTNAYKLLTVRQLAQGSVPITKLHWVGRNTMWGLIVLGSLMIVGLFSRMSSFGAAGLLLMFYLAAPPWPGVPEPAGPEHSMIVNKNLIECIACLALASLPTGNWLGIDALINRFLFKETDI